MVNGIPAILGYYKDNHNYVPDDIVIGADVPQINAFFTRNLSLRLVYLVLADAG
jgi:hypothetical protein